MRPKVRSTLSIANSILKDWKSKLRLENSNTPAETKLGQLKSTTQTNKFICDCFMKSNQIQDITSETKME